MAVGQGALLGHSSYMAIGREIALGTYNTATAALDFVSCSLKTTQEVKVLEQIERSRTFSKQVQSVINIGGDIEFYFSPRVAACNYILQQALGGAITSATATGETAGGSAFTHIITQGTMDLSYTSLCINLRKGQSSGGFIFNYGGVRVNELSITGEVDNPLMLKASVICMNATQTSNNVESSLNVTNAEVLNFIGGRLSVEANFNSLTSSSFWHVQSFELSLNNSLKGDNESRRIGSANLVVLPAGVASMELKATIRFDTMTAYSAMLNNTQLSCELEFLGNTLSTSIIREGLKMQFPRVYISDAGDPEIGGPDEILQAEVMFQVLRDDSTITGGYAMRALVTNSTANYL